MTKANLVLAAAATVLCVGCLVLFRDLSSERSRAHALEAQVAQLQRDMKRPEPAAFDNGIEPANEPEQSAPEQPAAAPSTTATSTPTTEELFAAMNRAEHARQRRMLADPVYRAARVAEQRFELQTEHPQLAAELGLSKDEVDRFLDFLAEQSVREYESTIKEQPGEDMQQRRKKLLEQQQQERREFLGEQQFQRWTDYVNSAGARSRQSVAHAACDVQLAATRGPDQTTRQGARGGAAATLGRAREPQQRAMDGRNTAGGEGRIHGTTRRVGRAIHGSVERSGRDVSRFHAAAHFRCDARSAERTDTRRGRVVSGVLGSRAKSKSRSRSALARIQGLTSAGFRDATDSARAAASCLSHRGSPIAARSCRCAMCTSECA